MPSSLPGVERARPLLGTLVAIRVHGLSDDDADRAIREAFGEVALVHSLMSFQEPESDISRLNRDAADQAVKVHAATFEVLQRAEEISRLSDGCFDITIAPQLVALGILPVPNSRREPDPQATWRDISLEPNHRVRFRRPLWIDLGGIAKGYAVDRAIDHLRGCGAQQACVTAGGDLRIFGPESERVLLRTGGPLQDNTVPVLEVENGAVASSGSVAPDAASNDHDPHIDGRSRRCVARGRFVSVRAEHCVVADALTKVVLALEEESEPILRRYGASAHLHDLDRFWRHLAV